MSHHIQLSQAQNNFQLKKEKGFTTIKLLKMEGHDIMTEDGVPGLRFTLSNGTDNFTCFSWGMPDDEDFSCFDVIQQFDAIDLAVKSSFNLFTIQPEGINWRQDTFINIELEVE